MPPRLDELEPPDKRVADCCQQLREISGRAFSADEPGLGDAIMDVVKQLETLPKYHGLKWFMREAKMQVLDALQVRLPDRNNGNLYCPDYIHDIVEKLLGEVRDEVE